MLCHPLYYRKFCEWPKQTLQCSRMQLLIFVQVIAVYYNLHFKLDYTMWGLIFALIRT